MDLIQSAQPSVNFNGEMDISDLVRTLRLHWRRITGFTIGCAAIAVVSVLLTTPQFTINGSVFLGDTETGHGSQPDQQQNVLTDFTDYNDVETQIELISSKALVEQAVLETGLNAPVSAGGAAKLNFLTWALFHRHQVSAFAPRPGDLQALYASLATPQRAPVRFDVEIGPNGSFEIVRPGWLGGAPVLTGTLGQPASGGGLSLLLKPAIDGAVPAAGSVFHLQVTAAEAVADSLQNSGALAVAAGGSLGQPSKIANIAFRSADPYTARLFVDQLMRDFIANQLSWKTQSASATEAFISDQLASIRTSLADADQKLAAYQSQTGILDVPQNAGAVISQLSQYEVQRTNLALQQEALQQLATQIAKPHNKLDPYLLGQANDNVLAGLASSLATSEAQMDGMGVQFTGNTAQVETVAATIAKLQQSIRSVVNNDLTLATGNLHKMDETIAQFQAQLKTMPAESLQVVALTRSSDVFGQLYVLLMQKEEEAEVSKAATIIDTRVIMPAEVPLGMTQPQPLITTIIGAMVGFLTGCGLALGKRALSGSFQTDDEIRRLVKSPVSGMLPKRSRRDAGGFFPVSSQGPFAEAFRLVRSNLYEADAGRGSTVVLVTSASVADGKTTVAANLAKTLADDGKRVILVDADLRIGSVQRAINASPTAGLSEWLATMRRPPIHRFPEQQFAVLPSGALPPNPAELLNRAYLKDIITTLRAEFDYVIIDSPPLPVVADGFSLGKHADLVLSVVRTGHTARRPFIIHNETLAKLDRPRSIIINGVMEASYGYGYGYKYAYHPPAPPHGIIGTLRSKMLAISTRPRR